MHRLGTCSAFSKNMPSSISTFVKNLRKMGIRMSRKVQPARHGVANNQWIEMQDASGNTILFNPSKRMYSSVEHGNWYTNSYRKLLVSRGFSLPEDSVWCAQQRQRLRQAGLNSDGDICRHVVLREDRQRCAQQRQMLIALGCNLDED